MQHVKLGNLYNIIIITDIANKMQNMWALFPLNWLYKTIKCIVKSKNKIITNIKYFQNVLLIINYIYIRDKVII